MALPVPHHPGGEQAGGGSWQWAVSFWFSYEDTLRACTDQELLDGLLSSLLAQLWEITWPKAGDKHWLPPLLGAQPWLCAKDKPASQKGQRQAVAGPQGSKQEPPGSASAPHNLLGLSSSG